MHSGRILDYTRVLGAPEGWDKEKQGSCGVLYVRDVMTGAGHAMSSAWFPTLAELQRLNAGAPVYLTVIGVNHPPVTLGVGEPADAVRRFPRVKQIIRSILGIRAATIVFDDVPNDEQLATLREHLK